LCFIIFFSFFYVVLYTNLMNLFIIYSRFQPLILDFLELRLHNFFILFFMNSSWSNHEFNRLSQVDSWFFLLHFQIDFFSQFHLLTLDWLEIRFKKICLFIMLFQSHDLNRKFDKLTWVDFIYFSGFIF